MTPCESIGKYARYLDALADNTPTGILGTPFGVVSDALRVVASSVWDVDPSAYRAGIAWAWYLGARPGALAVDGFRALLCAALVSECAPLVRESQTVGELITLLLLWMDYRPVFADMEALFATYGVRVDVRAISDPEGQTLMPVDSTRLAFYIFVLSMDWSRPMLLGEIAETARRASPMGARPLVLFYVEGSVSVPVASAPTDGFVWVPVWETAVEPIPPAPAQSLDVFFFYAHNQSTSSPMAVQFSANDYWFAYVIDSDDRTALQSFGVALAQQSSGKYLVKGNNSQFVFEILGLYNGIRTGDLSADLSNFYCKTSSSGELQIRNRAAYTTNTVTWKCRITKI